MAGFMSRRNMLALCKKSRQPTTTKKLLLLLLLYVTYLSIEQYVGRLYVPVQHVERVHVVEPLCHVESDAGDRGFLQIPLPVYQVLQHQSVIGIYTNQRQRRNRNWSRNYNYKVIIETSGGKKKEEKTRQKRKIGIGVGITIGKSLSKLAAGTGEARDQNAMPPLKNLAAHQVLESESGRKSETDGIGTGIGVGIGIKIIIGIGRAR